MRDHRFPFPFHISENTSEEKKNENNERTFVVIGFAYREQDVVEYLEDRSDDRGKKRGKVGRILGTSLVEWRSEGREGNAL